MPPGAVAAQDAPPLSPVLTLDQNRLYTQSRFGRRVTAELEAVAARLAAESKRIDAELEAEERDLTERRAEMDPEAFRALADAFDAKVVRTREEQLRKARELDARADAERQRFFEAALPVLLEILREAGAVALLENRAIILSADAIEITDLALRRVDTTLGDGTRDAGAPGQGPAAPAPDAPAAE